MRIEIVDVGPRDGLQNEDETLAPEVRAELCEKLAERRASRASRPRASSTRSWFLKWPAPKR